MVDLDELRMYVDSILFNQVSIPMYEVPYVEYKIIRKKTNNIEEFRELGHMDLFEKIKNKVFGSQWTVHYGIATAGTHITAKERNEMIHAL